MYRPGGGGFRPVHMAGPGKRGEPVTAVAALEALSLRGNARDFQLHTLAQGDRAVDMAGHLGQCRPEWCQAGGGRPFNWDIKWPDMAVGWALRRRPVSRL